MTAENKYQIISLSGGGYRAALFHAGVLRAFHASGFFDPSRHVIINSVSGGALPTMLWQNYMFSSSAKSDNQWPEQALLDLVCSTPKLGGMVNWQLRGGWFWARQRWEAFVHDWWQRHQLPPETNVLRLFGARSNTQFLVEMLDYHYGQFWLYNGSALHQANRDFFKTGDGFMPIPISPAQAIVTATAFPIFFTGLKVRGRNQESYLFKDAGVVDNTALLPLLEIIKRKPSDNTRLGKVDFWFLSDAGKPMSVPPNGELIARGVTVAVPKIGLIDRIFRLTGDLAQPQMSAALFSLLKDYADIRITGTGLNLVGSLEDPWLVPAFIKGWTAVNIPTTLCGMNRELAVCIMSAGAQSASYVLAGQGLIKREKRESLAGFFRDLLNAL